jgi:hypothetical protein
MALKNKIETAFGVTINDAYCKVDSIQIRNKNNISFNLFSYANISNSPISTKPYTCDYNINGENPIKQAYLHLKTLPEFSDATDC